MVTTGCPYRSGNLDSEDALAHKIYTRQSDITLCPLSHLIIQDEHRALPWCFVEINFIIVHKSKTIHSLYQNLLIRIRCSYLKFTDI